MNCKDFQDYSSAYIDAYLSKEEKEKFEEHLNKCYRCKNKYNNLVTIVEATNHIGELALPKDFKRELNKKLLNDNRPKKPISFPKMRVITSIAAILILVIISLPIINNFSAKPFLAKDIAPAEEAQETREFAGMDVGTGDKSSRVRSVGPTNAPLIKEFDQALSRKIIQRGTLSIEVEDFDQAQQNVMSLIEELDGFVQNSEIYYYTHKDDKPEESLKQAHMELRIPELEFNRSFEKIKSFGLVIEENISGEDITENYMDIDNQVKNLNIQEERLREILQEAKKVEDLLQVENELNRVRTQINQLTASLQAYDKLVSLATINLNIKEVTGEKATLTSLDDNIWSKSRNNFIYSLNNMVKALERGVINFFGLLPILLILIIIGGPLGYFAHKRLRKRKTSI